MKLVVTVDTEEDNWGRYSATDNPVHNIEKIVSLQKIFDQYAVKPTYLITYPVATNPRSVAILKRILEQGKCEIGTHCHPWNTPPFNADAVIHEKDTMLCNLPEKLILEKLTTLHEAIIKNFNYQPVSFRAGRWGFGPSVARVLEKMDYRVDSSVTPFVNWDQYYGPDFSSFRLKPYRFNAADIQSANAQGALLEIPVSIGYLQSNFEHCKKWENNLNNKLFNFLSIRGLLQRLKILNKIWLSPEYVDARTMIRLVNQIQKNKINVLNFTFHSTSLTEGLSATLDKRLSESLILKRIDNFLKYTAEAGTQNLTLAEYEVRHKNKNSASRIY